MQLAYRLQADHLGDLDGECQRLLDRSESPETAGQRAADLGRRTAELRPGTVLGREWNGRMPNMRDPSRLTRTWPCGWGISHYVEFCEVLSEQKPPIVAQ